jgi:YD repeat-containing protein
MRRTGRNLNLRRGHSHTTCWLCILFAITVFAAPATAATYLYDALGRVTAVTDDNGLTTAYVYDAAGNRSTVSTASTPSTGQVVLIVARDSGATTVPLVVSGAYTSVAVAVAPTHGTATASGTSITYTPTTYFAGADSFTYTASNGTTTSAPATVSVAVSPSAGAVVGFNVAYGPTGNPVPLRVFGAYTGVGVAVLPGHGMASPSGTTMTYTPATGYSGPDSFQYTASIAGATSAPANVSITVGPPPPVANPFNASVFSNTTNAPIPLNITGGAPSSVAVATPATHGAASVSPPGGATIVYTPTGGYIGSDSFTYTASNASGTSAAAMASIAVVPMTASVPNPSPCCATGSTLSYTFPQTQVTVTGGSGSYHYQWNVISDSFGNWSGGSGGATSQTITPYVQGVTMGNTSVGGYSCTVTDTVTGSQTTSNIVTYTYTRTGGG